MEDQNSIEVEAHQEKIRNAYKQQKHSKCIEFIDQSPESIRAASQYKILKASCINNIGGRTSEAHLILDNVISAEPGSAFAYYGKGLVFINEGKLEESVKCFSKAIEIDPSEKMNKARHMKSRAENMLRPISKVCFSRAAPATEGVRTKAKAKTQRLSNGVKDEILKHCEVCQKTFAKNYSLARHMLLHTGERPHKCHICGYAFIQRSDLDRHLATHSDVTNFPCPSCPKRFKTKKNLQCHSITHSTHRPFKCSFCEKTFKLRRLLTFHEGGHKGDKPFNCDICGKGFPAKQYIKTHLKTHLSKNKTPPAKIMTKMEKLEPIDIKTEMIFEESSMDESERVDHIIRNMGDDSLTFGDISSNPDENSDLHFCLSLLKDISRMTSEQKSDFKEMINASISSISLD